MAVDMQKKIFMNGEGDAWFQRNHGALENRTFDGDSIVKACQNILASNLPGGGGRLLEVGCGEGRRLAWMQEHLGLECHGVEPSMMAVDMAKRLGIHATQGTAEQLPYEDGRFDVVVFGFCLYLCDREELFRIAFEADRVLKEQGWLIIHDFYASTPMRREYHHKAGIYSYKMDYRRLFDWHPAYTCFSHEVMHHGKPEMTDDEQEWVATSVLRKSMNNG